MCELDLVRSSPACRKPQILPSRIVVELVSTVALRPSRAAWSSGPGVELCRSIDQTRAADGKGMISNIDNNAVGPGHIEVRNGNVGNIGLDRPPVQDKRVITSVARQTIDPQAAGNQHVVAGAAYQSVCASSAVGATVKDAACA